MLILSIGESNHRFSVQTFSDRSIGHALVAWQSGILQSQGARFCIQILLTEESNRRLSVQLPLRPQHRPCACRIAIGHPAKPGYPFLYAILPIGESSHGFSVQTPSDYSIGHTLIVWQSGILQSQGARFYMVFFQPGNLIADSAFRSPLTAV